MTDLFARKGEAEPLFLEPEPSAPFPGGLPEFRHRRTLAMPSLCVPAGESAAWDRRPAAATGAANPIDGVRRRRPTARATEHAIHRRPSVTRRLRFTFRLDLDRHRRFEALASRHGLSRQKLLTDILDRALEAAERDGLEAARSPSRRPGHAL